MLGPKVVVELDESSNTSGAETVVVPEAKESQVNSASRMSGVPPLLSKIWIVKFKVEVGWSRLPVRLR